MSATDGRWGAGDPWMSASGEPPTTYGPWGPTPPAQWAPPSTPPPRPRTRASVAAAVAAVVFAASVGMAVGRQVHRSASHVAAPDAVQSIGGSNLTAADQAIAARISPALVDINTKLAYQRAAAAGTGMVLTSSGEVLTNNHVISGATTITATVVGTGRTYTAKVVGTDRTADVAVLQLEGASGLKTIPAGDASTAGPGDRVIAIGNAGGVGGAPSVVTGTVVALGQSITASNDDGSGAEQLRDLIETNTPIQPGDSGGPLVNESGRVIGMDTAASTGSRFSTRANLGFAIPLGAALSIAKQIESGQGSATVQIGTPGFLGVQIQPSAAGAVVGGVPAGTPADRAGIAAGDVITSVDGTAIDSPSALTAALHTHKPGDVVRVGWTDPAGSRHNATVTLIAGPAD